MRILMLCSTALFFLSCGRSETDLRKNAGASETDLNATDVANPSPVGETQPTQTGRVSPTHSPRPPQVGGGGAPDSQPANDKAKKGQGKVINLDSLVESFELPIRPESNAEDYLWATYYYTPRLLHAESGYDLIQLNGIPLGPRLSKLGWCQAAMEGSVQIFYKNAWRTYNYAGVSGAQQVDCSEYYDHPVGRTRYKVARGPFGDGVQSYILQPFRTIAVDPDVIPYGSVIYIPEARGLQFNLPNGQQRVHDGYFFAADTGGLINGNHIDVFLGIATRSPFHWITSRSSSRVPYEVVKGPDLIRAFYKIHTLN